MNIIDLTFTYETGQTVGNPKNHPTVALTRMAKIEETGFNTRSILLGSHIGTHMDAPNHMIKDGSTIDKTPLSMCAGPVTVIDVRHIKQGQCVNVSDVAKFALTERLLFVFGWHRHYATPTYHDRWPCFSLKAAEYLAEHGVKLIAMDTPSPDPKSKGEPGDFPVHRSLLKKDIILIESLANTDKIDFQKEYSIVAFPLKLKDCDGSPCRVAIFQY